MTATQGTISFNNTQSFADILTALADQATATNQLALQQINQDILDALTVDGPLPVTQTKPTMVAGFSTEILTADGTVNVPANTYSITAMNTSSATLTLTIGSDTQTIPPNGSYNFCRDPQCEDPFTGAAALATLTGAIGGSEVIFNYKTVA